MQCSKCGKWTDEKGDCEDCLPYNMYIADRLRQVDPEALRRLMLAHVEELRQLSFKQVDFADVDELQILVVVVPGVGRVAMIPCVDTAGYESVVFVTEPAHLKEGHHRM